MPNLAQRTLPQVDWPSETESRILRADQSFEKGKKLYQRGDYDAARAEFNHALDILLTASENLPNRQKIDRKLDQLVDAIYRYDEDGLGAGDSSPVIVFDKSPIDSMLEMTFPTDPNLRPQVMDEIKATVSQLPLEVNDSVLSYINYFSSERGRKTLIAGLRRSGRYRPLIQRILDEEGVPQELIYLAQAESGFMPRAVSNKQAEGMWQFVQFRGREYGLMQGPGTDDRLDPEKATRAAARHLRDLYIHYGDWYLAMAAYNCGPGCVDRAIERTGYADFWELRNRGVLPRQTDNYVPLILAITIMAKNAKDYGLQGLDLDQPVEYDTLTVTSPTSLALIADAADRPLSEIRDLNPSLLGSVAPAGSALHVPKGTSNSVMAALQNVPADRRSYWRMHRVTTGETLAQIAKEFRMQASSIAAVNNLQSEGPESGDLLIIPAAYHPDASPTRAHAGKKSSARYAKTSYRSRRSSNSRQISDRVLHRRAPAKTLKVAAVRAARNAQ
jgi:membrane-bound lytic murein transglycosylase D